MEQDDGTGKKAVPSMIILIAVFLIMCVIPPSNAHTQPKRKPIKPVRQQSNSNNEFMLEALGEQLEATLEAMVMYDRIQSDHSLPESKRVKAGIQYSSHQVKAAKLRNQIDKLEAGQ